MGPENKKSIPGVPCGFHTQRYMKSHLAFDGCMTMSVKTNGKNTYVMKFVSYVAVMKLKDVRRIGNILEC